MVLGFSDGAYTGYKVASMLHRKSSIIPPALPTTPSKTAAYNTVSPLPGTARWPARQKQVETAARLNPSDRCRFQRNAPLYVSVFRCAE